MKKVDTSDWSVVCVLADGIKITHKTLCSKEYILQMCGQHGWELISFQKGTNSLCE
jgi:hypothetical protein